MRQLVASGQQPATVAGNTEQFNHWHQYFETRLGWVPRIVQQVGNGQMAAMTMPTNYPDEFELSFTADPNWRPNRPFKVRPEKQQHETLGELRRRYGPSWGIKDVKGLDRTRPPGWSSPTDDELRAIYGTRGNDQT